MTTKNGCKNYLELFLQDEVQITSLCLSKSLQVLFAGTNKGTVRVYLWPIIKRKHNQDREPEYAEFFIHLTSITSLRVTYDKRYLISSSEDGSIFFSKLIEFYNGVDFNENSSNIQNADPVKKKVSLESEKIYMIL